MDSDENVTGSAAARRAEKARRAAELREQPQAAPARVSQKRLVRTIVLGAVAVLVAIAWLAREFGIETRELIGFFGSSLLLVLMLAVLGLAGAALLWLFRRLRGR